MYPFRLSRSIDTPDTRTRRRASRYSKIATHADKAPAELRSELKAKRWGAAGAGALERDTAVGTNIIGAHVECSEGRIGRKVGGNTGPHYAGRRPVMVGGGRRRGRRLVPTGTLSAGTFNSD